MLCECVASIRGFKKDANEFAIFEQPKSRA